MSYIKQNKLAWEESFENRKQNWGDDNHIRLKNERLPFFNDDMKANLEKIDFRGKTVAQFCCNNGRELLSLMGLGVKSAVGFDIAENIIAQAKDTAAKAGINNCEFVACNILDIATDYHGQFDVLLLTVGAICWFEDLTPFFAVASKCLKDNGILLINEIHPFENMLPVPGEEAFDADNLNRFAYSYFRAEPWIENSGMGYISGKYDSKTFTSFSHTMSAIINALSENGLKTARLEEYDYDIGLTDVYDGKGFPLSFFLLAEKGTS